MGKCDDKVTIKKREEKMGKRNKSAYLLTYYLTCISLLAFLAFPVLLFSWTQTDWSAGDSQLLWPDPNGTSVSKYWWGGDVDVTDTPGSVYLALPGTTYVDTGIIFSSWRDASVPVKWDKISWISQDAILKKGAYTRGLWYMDEGGNANTVLDSSGGGYNGTFKSTPTLWLTGRLGYPGDKALGLSLGNYVEVSPPDSGLYLANLSVECWVNPVLALSPQTILSLGDGENEGWWLGTDNQNHFEVKIRTSSGTYSVKSGKVTFTYITGVWYHVAFTYDGSNLVLYVNGDVKASRNVPPGDITYGNSPPLRFGDPTTPFYGGIDLVRITAGALTDREIALHAKPEYVIFYTRDGDTTNTDTDTEEIPTTAGWSPVYLYGNEDYAELEIVRWSDNFNDDDLDTSLWNVGGETSKVQETNQRLEISGATAPSGVTSTRTVGRQFSLTHSVTPVAGRTVSEISNQDTGFLQENVLGNTGYRVLFENGEVYAQYINDGTLSDTQFLGNYNPGTEYRVTWERWDVAGTQNLTAVVTGVGSYQTSTPDYTPSYLAIHSSGTAYFDNVKVKPIARYLQYRAYLKTLDNAYSPALDEVRITFAPVGGDNTSPESVISLPLRDNRDTDLFRVKYIDNQVTYCFGSVHQSPIVINGTSTDTGSGVDYVEISWGKRPQGGTWPTSYNDYSWSSWDRVTDTSTGGNYSTWQYELSADDLDEAGYLIRVRAVDNSGNEETLPTNATKTIEVSEADGGDSALVNMMKDITPPRLVWESGYYPQIKPSWRGGSNGNDITDIDNRDSGWIEINTADTWLISRTPSFKIWVEDKNPTGSVNDASGLNETALPDSPPQYAYSTDGVNNYTAWSDIVSLDTPFEGAVHPDKKFLEIDKIPFNQESRVRNLLKVRVYDRAGNEMLLSDTAFAVDTTPMTTSIVSTTAAPDSSTADFTWTSYDPYAQAYPSQEDQVSDTYLVRWRLLNYTPDNNKWSDPTQNYGFVDGATNTTLSAPYSNLEKGKTYIFQVRYLDKAGNYETQETWGLGGNTYYWTIESDTPKVQIIQGPAGITSSNVAYFRWRSVGDSAATQGCNIYLDGNLIPTSSYTWSGSNGIYEGTYTTGSLSPGSHTFYVEVYYTSTPANSDIDIRTWIYRSSENTQFYYPIPPRRFWTWEEGD